MYRPAAFVVDDVAALLDVIRGRVFATIAIADGDKIQFAYAPVVLDKHGNFGELRFHLARGNAVCAQADGKTLSFSFMGPDAYVSPDWYESEGLVPTWNYIAVEATGIAHKLSRAELRQLLIDISAQEEEKLPKPPWTIGKVQETRIEALLNGIEGFSVPLETLTGKFKLSQDKNPADIAGVIANLEARGDAASVAVANAMRKLK